MVDISPQQKVGQSIQRRIRKSLKPRAADVGIAIVEGINTGLKSRLKDNFSYMNDNITDEEERLVQLFKDYEKEVKIVDGLKKKGNGDLTEGIFQANIEGVKNAAGIEGLEAIATGLDTDSNLFISLRKEAEEQSRILQERLTGYSKLVTKFDEEDAAASDIFADDVKTKAQFKQPVISSLNNLMISQKNLGINNPLDAIGSALKLNDKNKFNVLAAFHKKELELQNIFEETNKYRGSLPTYAGSSEVLSKFIQEKETSGSGSKAAQRKLEKVEDKFNKLVQYSQMWARSKNFDENGKYNYSFYFMPLLDQNAKDIKANQNKAATPEELADFIEYYNKVNPNDQISRESIFESFYEANQYVESFKNQDLAVRFSQAIPTVFANKNVLQREQYNEANQIYAEHQYNLSLVPDHLKNKIIYGLGDSLRADDVKALSRIAVDKNDLVLNSEAVENVISAHSMARQKGLYSALGDDKKMAFQIAVIAQAKQLMEINKMEKTKAYQAAVDTQLLGVRKGQEWTEILGSVFEDAPEFNFRREEYREQQFLAYDSANNSFVAEIFRLEGNRSLDETQIEGYNRELNESPILWYKPSSIGKGNPELLEDGQTFSLNNGKSVWVFQRNPDADGKHWILQN